MSPSVAASATGPGGNARSMRNPSSINSIVMGDSDARARAGYAPSYAESQFDTIVRRQRIRPHGALKLPPQKTDLTRIPSEDESNHPPPRLVREFDFAGWGSTQYLEVTPAERDAADAKWSEHERKVGTGAMGTWFATGVAGVAVAGSPFYAFPPVVGVAGVFSPISLLISGLLLSFWRPIMAELASALPANGANYLYLLNGSTSKLLATFGAVVTLLDDAVIAVVSAATASSYLAQQGHIPFSYEVLTVLILIGITIFCFSGVRNTAGATCACLIFHLLCMFAMFVAGVVHWGKNGNALLHENWVAGQPGSASLIAKNMFQGVCLGFLGATGFESTPDYNTQIRPGIFPSILRNLQVITILVNAPVMLVTYAILPSSQIIGNASVLNTVAETVAGPALRIIMTVDAGLILCAGILTGVLSADALIERLAIDGVLPSFLLYRLPITNAPALAMGTFTAGSLIIYGSSGANLDVLSGLFAFTFLFTLLLFPISSLVLSYNRPRLARAPRPSLIIVVFTIALSITLIVGNSVLAPKTIGYFATYTIVMFAAFYGLSVKSGAVKLVWWLLDHGLRTRGLAKQAVGAMIALRGGPVIVFVETDEINRLFERLLYVRNNEETSCVKLVHCYHTIEAIPSELEANHKILDEAFPSLTVDLVFVEGAFSPSMVNVVADRLGVASQLCFIGCPGSDFRYSMNEFPDVRIIDS